MDKSDGLSVQKNIVWNSIGNIIYLVFQWVLTIVVVRISGYTTAGNYALAMSVTNIFFCIAAYGMRSFQVSDVREDYSQKEYIASRLITSALSLIACALFLILGHYSWYLFLVIIVYFTFKLSEAMVDVLHGVDQKKWRMDIVGKSYIIRGAITLLLFTGILMASQNLVLAITGMMLGAFAVILFYDWPQCRRLWPFEQEGKLSIDRVKKLLIECAPLAVYICISSCIGSIPRIYLEKMLGSELLGVYASIATPAVIVQVAAMYIFNPMTALFAEYYAALNVKSFLKLVGQCFLAILAITISVVIGVYFLGQWGLNLLFGPSILPYASLLMPVVGCTILTAIAWLLCTILTVMRDFKGLIFSNVIALGSCVLLSQWFIPLYSLNGANMALAGGLIIEILCLTVFGVVKSIPHFKGI